MLRLIRKRQIRVFDNCCHISTPALKVAFQHFQNKRQSSRQRERAHKGERARENKNFPHQPDANRSDGVSRWISSPQPHLHCSRSYLKTFSSCSNHITFIRNYSECLCLVLVMMCQNQLQHVLNRDIRYMLFVVKPSSYVFP